MTLSSGYRYLKVQETASGEKYSHASKWSPASLTFFSAPTFWLPLGASTWVYTSVCESMKEFQLCHATPWDKTPLENFFKKPRKWRVWCQKTWHIFFHFFAENMFFSGYIAHFTPKVSSFTKNLLRETGHTFVQNVHMYSLCNGWFHFHDFDIDCVLESDFSILQYYF